MPGSDDRPGRTGNPGRAGKTLIDGSSAESRTLGDVPGLFFLDFFMGF
jgi:hypothetical protein